MAGASDQNLAVATVYSDAMIDLAQAQGEVEFLLNELRDFTSQMDKDDDFRNFVESPTIDVDARRQTIDKLFRGRYSDVFVDSLQILNRKGRLEIIKAVAEAYRHESEERQGRVEVFVETASPLTQELRDQIRDVAAKQTGMEPKLVESVDEALIGGLVLRIGDQKYDASVATKLSGLAEVLHDRASREIHSGRSHWEGDALH